MNKTSRLTTSLLVIGGIIGGVFFLFIIWWISLILFGSFNLVQVKGMNGTFLMQRQSAMPEGEGFTLYKILGPDLISTAAKSYKWHEGTSNIVELYQPPLEWENTKKPTYCYNPSNKIVVLPGANGFCELTR